jgi:hypothetical protein
MDVETYNDSIRLLTSDIIAFIITFMVCVECAKEPEFQCSRCHKVYKQEGRYKAHIVECIVEDARECAQAPIVSHSDFSELLRQNREMLDLMRKQQETIQLLVAQLVPGAKISNN